MMGGGETDLPDTPQTSAQRKKKRSPTLDPHPSEFNFGF